MTALVDRLRDLPGPVRRALLARLAAEHGHEALAALRWPFELWARPEQALPDPTAQWTIQVFAGERGAGKSWCSAHLFAREVLAGRARRARIVTATRDLVGKTIAHGDSGLLEILPPWARPEFFPSMGSAGVFVFPGGREAHCYTADAPGSFISTAYGLTWADDPIAWVKACGANVAAASWREILITSRSAPGRIVVSTTPEGVPWIQDLLTPDQRSGVVVQHLGTVESNASNLEPNYLRTIVPKLKAEGQWDDAAASPFVTVDLGRLRLDVCPPLVELGIAIDPSLSTGARACEVGIVGGGRDARSVVHLRHDRSDVLDAGATGWPAVAWDLAEELQRDHPGVPWHFAMESNTGKRLQELLRGEERVRRLRRGLPEVSVCEIRLIRADKDKCRRAESPARLAAQGQVRLAPGLARLEGQLRGLAPGGTSSDRADAAVHLVTDLAGLGDDAVARQAREVEVGREAAVAGAQVAAEVSARLAARLSPRAGARRVAL